MGLTIERMVTGTIGENCYVVYDDKNLLIVDPGDEADKLIKWIDSFGRTPRAILLTHTHYDHIGAVEALRKHYSIPVYVSPDEQEWLGNPIHNLSGLDRHNDIKDIIVSPAEFEFEIDKTYDIDGLKFKVVATPGHSIGSVSFIFDDFVVTGDALFKGSIGRTDLYTGSLPQLLQSIDTQLFTLSDDYVVYPGHGDSTTIGNEKNTNPFFN